VLACHAKCRGFKSRLSRLIRLLFLLFNLQKTLYVNVK
jgi:hypothetical protein